MKYMMSSRYVLPIAGRLFSPVRLFLLQAWINFRTNSWLAGEKGRLNDYVTSSQWNVHDTAVYLLFKRHKILFLNLISQKSYRFILSRVVGNYVLFIDFTEYDFLRVRRDLYFSLGLNR